MHMSPPIRNEGILEGNSTLKQGILYWVSLIMTGRGGGGGELTCMGLKFFPASY